MHFRHPQIQVQAILARAWIRKNHVVIDVRLNAARPVLGRLSHSAPRRRRLRRLPAQRAYRWCSVRDSFERANLAVSADHAFQNSIGRLLLHVAQLRPRQLGR